MKPTIAQPAISSGVVLSSSANFVPHHQIKTLQQLRMLLPSICAVMVHLTVHGGKVDEESMMLKIGFFAPGAVNHQPW